MYVIEQNRDAQMRSLLVNELEVDPELNWFASLNFLMACRSRRPIFVGKSWKRMVEKVEDNAHPGARLGDRVAGTWIFNFLGSFNFFNFFSI